jgi:hypothetical protein
MPNAPTPPPAAQERSVSLPVKVVENAHRALVAALRLASSHDAVNAALSAADRPQPSPLSQQINSALAGLAGHGESAAPEERADQHTFTLDQLNEPFVGRLLLERGWQQAQIVVGSAQGEALARRMLHGLPPDSHVSGRVRLAPLSGGNRVEQRDGWTLREL